MGLIARVRSSELALHGALVFGGVAIASLFNYLYYALIGRIAGVETYGVVTSLASALLVVSAPATMVQTVAARLAADLEARGDLAAIRRLADLVTRQTGLAAAAVLVLCVLFSRQLAGFFNLSSPVPIVIASLGAALLAVVAAQRGVFQGSHRFADFSASVSIDCVGKVLVGIALVVPFGANGALCGIVASLAGAATYAQVAFGKRFGAPSGALALDRALIKRVASNVGVAQLIFTVLMFYDVPLIKHAFDARSAGLYAAAALVGRAVIAAISFVPTLIMPKATARAAAQRSPLPLLGIALLLAGGVVLVAVVAALLAPRLVVTLIAGRAFGEAASLVFLYVVASSTLALANVVAAYKMGLHRYDFVPAAAVVAILEIVVFATWHPSLSAAVGVLAAGHGAILVATLYRLTAPAPWSSPVAIPVVDL